jgi:hypothetical protein
MKTLRGDLIAFYACLNCFNQTGACSTIGRNHCGPLLIVGKGLCLPRLMIVIGLRL